MTEMPTNKIPAMTTDEERQTYYRLAKELASEGEIVELGAWLGASTVYIAAGIRDSGVDRKVHVFDRFKMKELHKLKQKQFYGHANYPKIDVNGSLFKAFKDHLGPLFSYVEPHAGEIRDMKWNGGNIALIVTDAPKRVPEISKAMTAFVGSVHVGTVMAWQDFSYFASYDIPACMTRLSDHVEFVEAVYPGTTAVFRVTKPWTAADVTEKALSLKTWTPDEVMAVWDRWEAMLPEQIRPRWACGASMFLCDIGAPKPAVARLRKIVAEHPDEVLPKWRYFREHRPAFVTRYAPLFAEIPA